MRSHEAGQQANALERVTGKLLTRLNLDQWDDKEQIITAVADTLLEAYALGGIEAMAIAPLEGKEVVFRARPTPALMGSLLNDGWAPWAITETSWRAFEDEPDKAIPANWKRAKGEPNRKTVTHHGWIVRFTRRAVPRAVVMPTTQLDAIANGTAMTPAEAKREMGYCTYPECKCIVQTSTSAPEPVCPLKLEPLPEPTRLAPGLSAEDWDRLSDDTPLKLIPINSAAAGNYIGVVLQKTWSDLAEETRRALMASMESIRFADGGSAQRIKGEAFHHIAFQVLEGNRDDAGFFKKDFTEFYPEQVPQ